LFDVLDFIDDDKIDLMISKNIADKFGGVVLLELLEVENEIVMLVAIYDPITPQTPHTENCYCKTCIFDRLDVDYKSHFIAG